MNVLIVALDAVLPTGVSEGEVLVVAPAVNSRLRRWLSDEDEARRRAQQLAAAIVDLLVRGGVHAEGRVGDADPLLTIADALATFAADEIVIACSRSRAPRRRTPSRFASRRAIPARCRSMSATTALPTSASHARTSRRSSSMQEQATTWYGSTTATAPSPTASRQRSTVEPETTP